MIKGGGGLISPTIVLPIIWCLMLLIIEVGVWRDVEVMVVGDVVCAFCEGVRAMSIIRCGGGLGAGETDGVAIVVEVRAPALFVCLGGGVKMPLRV